LNTSGVKKLLIYLSEYLINNLMLGGIDGAEMASEFTIIKLELAEDLAKLLILAESSA